MTRADMAYRKMAAEGASGFSLLIALYDTLAGNLRRAAEAQRDGDIEKRCREAKHALKVIGLLEDCVQRGSDGELSHQLISFYSSLRKNLIVAQVNNSAEMLEQNMAEVLKIRSIWQTTEDPSLSLNPSKLPPVALNGPSLYPSFQPNHSSGRWSA